MTQPDELKPCPFCGGEAIVNADGWAESSWWFAQCLGCQAQGGEHTSGEEALAAWNTRTPNLSRILKLAALSGKLIPEMKKRLNCLPTVVLSPFGKQFVAAYGQLTDEDHQLLEAVLKE